MVSHTREVTETQSREQPRIFNSQACHGQRWVLNFEGVAVGISEAVLTKRRANPTQHKGLGGPTRNFRKHGRLCFL